MTPHVMTHVVAPVVVVLAITLTLATLGGGAIGLARWARSTGRNPWLWVLGAYATLTLLMALVSGCGYPMIYVGKADMSRYDADSYECDRESVTFGGGSGIGAAVGHAAARSEARRLFIACLKARGYTVSDKPSAQ